VHAGHTGGDRKMDSGGPQAPAEAGSETSPPWPPVPGQSPPPPLPPPPSESGLPASTRRRALWIALGIAAVAGIVGAVLTQTVLKSPRAVALPNEIAGAPRLTTGAMTGAANGMIDDAGLDKGTSVAGFYGMAGTPEFIVVASEDSEAALIARDALRGVAEATDGDSSFAIDAGSITSEKRDGVAFDCAPATGSEAAGGGVCVWNDGTTFGLVMWFTQRGTMIDFASTVHDAMVR
jgi:hypothetical protein